jgi:ABC-type nitrate/sulfonate/bicarbonate transport system permease component
MTRSLRRAALGVAGIIVWLVCWQWATTVGPLAGTRGLPSASATFQEALELATRASFWASMGVTLATSIVALGLALLIGLVVGVVSGLSPVAFAILDPLVQFLRPLPPVVLLPLILLLMGPSTELAVFLAAFAATWPILIQTQAGVMAADPVMLDTARSMALPWWRTQVHVVVPGALPFVATGVRIAAAASLMLTVGAGIIAGTPGIGRLVVVAQETGQAEAVFAIIIWSGVLGLAFALTLGGLERVLLKNSAREVTT